MVVSDGRERLRFVKIGSNPKKSFMGFCNDAGDSKDFKRLEPNSWPSWLSIDFPLGYTNLSASGKEDWQPVWFTRTTTNNRASHGLSAGNTTYERPDGTVLAFSVESTSHMMALAFILHDEAYHARVFLGKDKPTFLGTDVALSKDIALIEKPVDRRAYEIHYRKRPVGLLIENATDWEVMHTTFKMTPSVMSALDRVGLANEGPFHV